MAKECSDGEIHVVKVIGSTDSISIARFVMMENAKQNQDQPTQESSGKKVSCYYKSKNFEPFFISNHAHHWKVPIKQHKS